MVNHADDPAYAPLFLRAIRAFSDHIATLLFLRAQNGFVARTIRISLITGLAGFDF